MKSRSAIKQQSKELLRGNWGKAVVMTLVPLLTILIWIMGTIFLMINGNFLMGVLFSILFVPVLIMVSVGIQYTFLDWARNGKIADDWFKQIWQVFADHRLAGKVIRVFFAFIIFKALWGMIFIIPSWIKTFDYSQALLIMKDHYDNGENVTARQCLKESSSLMNGYKEDFCIFQLSYIGWQFLGILSLFVGMLWVVPYIELGMVIFYNDLSQERAVRPTTMFMPDGTNVAGDLQINNQKLTRANWIAAGYELLLIALGACLVTFVPGVKAAVQDNTYLMSMKNSNGTKDTYYIRFYTDNVNTDNEIDSYFIFPASQSNKDRKIWNAMEKEWKNYPDTYEQQMKQAYRKGFRYDVNGNRLELGIKNTKITMTNLDVQNRGKKIIGRYSVNESHDHGKVTMTRMKNN